MHREVKKELPVQVEMEEIPSELPAINTVTETGIEIGEDEEEIEIRRSWIV